MKYGMKLSNYDIAMIGNLSALTEDKMKGILVDKGDIDPIKRVTLVGFLLEDFDDSFEMPNGKSMKRANRRKATFHKKEEQKTLAQSLGYNLSTEDSKVKNLLSANHIDRTYLRGEKADKKYLTVQEEKAIMEREAVEKARDAMEKEHDGILGAIAQDIDTLTLDAESIEYRIEDLETEYKELEEAMKLVSEKLKNAQLRKNGVFAALRQKEEEYKETNDKLMQEMHRFGW